MAQSRHLRKHAARWAAVFLVIFMLVKLAVWMPYRDFFHAPSARAFAKLAFMVAALFPPTSFDPHQRLVRLAGETYLIDDPEHPGLRLLLQEFPLPASIIDLRQPAEKRLEALAVHVARLLPKESPLPGLPEPMRATVLLGGNAQKARYPKICSKDAKIFVQYANALGFPARLIQAKHHILAEVYAEDEGRWKAFDPHFGCAVRIGRRIVSSVEAHDAIKQGEALNYCASRDVFGTVIVIPRTNFAAGKLPRWHYLSYDNLSYWRPKRP